MTYKIISQIGDNMYAQCKKTGSLKPFTCMFPVYKIQKYLIKIKVNLSLYLIRHHAMKTYGGVEI